MKKVFLTLAVVAAMAWGMPKLAEAGCLHYGVYCAGTSGVVNYVVCVPGANFNNLNEAQYEFIFNAINDAHCN